MDMNEIPFLNALLIIILWAGMFILDFYLTARAQREYNRNARGILVYEAGYQLDDPSRGDQDRPVFTPRSILSLISSTIALLVIWFVVVQMWDYQELYWFILGGLFLTILAVDIRHMQNIYLYRNTGTPNGLKGKLEYPGWLGYRSSALDMFTYSGLFLFIAIILSRWFLVGGAFGCAVTGVRHWIWSNRYRATSNSE